MKKEELLSKLEQEITQAVDVHRSNELEKTSSRIQNAVDRWKILQAQQQFQHKEKMFNMVFWMTIPTYLLVVIVTLSQVMHFQGVFPFIIFERLDLQTFGLVLTGFLAELLLLPKIILTGLFGGKNEKKI